VSERGNVGYTVRMTPDTPDALAPLPEPHFIRAYPPTQPAPGPSYWLPFRKGELVLHGDRLIYGVTPLPQEGRIEALISYYLGTLDGIPCRTCALVETTELPEGYRAVGLRSLYGLLPDAEYIISGYAAQILHWETDHRFCDHCGSKVEPEGGTWGKKCPNCGRTAYPPVVPAVLLLIHDGGDRVLMAQKPGWGKRFSIIAGFVEPGESLEDCCVREAREEVGVAVDKPQYGGSQSWPFPHQIMIGFTARYLGGEVVIDEAELARAAWFHYDDLPELPPPLSLSRQIIDAWVAGRRAAHV
jgi:NAD+ diphosphatase